MLNDSTPIVQAGYATDNFFSAIWSKPDEHKVQFTRKNGLLWRNNDQDVQ